MPAGFKAKIKDNKGIVLIVVYLTITSLLIFSLIFASRSINDKNIALRQKNTAWAFYIAESGLDRGVVWLRSQPLPPSGTAAFDPLAGPQALGGGTYSVSIDPDDNNSVTNLKRYRIISVGTAAGVTKSLTNEVQVDSYARFAYFTDTEYFRWYGWYRVPVWFVDGDTIEGPTQSNTNFNIKGNPIFDGPVKSGYDYTRFFNNNSPITTPNNISNPPYDVPEFRQGLNLGAEPMDMPSKALDLRVQAAQEGLQLQGPTTIVLNSNGQMNVTNSQKGWNNEEVPFPENGAIFVEGGDLTVSGTLDGQVTMGTNRNLVIADNVTYADDPRTTSSDDMLGLIAERDVVISRNAPADVEVDASIMALGNSFIVENWWTGSPKGTLTVYGGILQRERGPVGTFSSSTGQKLTGYSKDYNYDPRLITTPPPFFPTTGDYITLSWKEE